MLKINFNKIQPNLKILCIGAHSDDIEIGCGGTILRLIEENQKVDIQWIVFSANEIRTREAQKSANLFLKKNKSNKINIRNFRESYFPFIGSEIKDYFEQIRNRFDPDIVFTHYQNDKHQDHALISKLTWNTFRNHLILEYEIPKYDGDLENPNFFVQLAETIVNMKIKIICETFKSQTSKSWFSNNTFRSILRIRGVESNSSSGYSEAFYCHKLCY